MGLFGKEKITITLEKFDYSPGETIKGIVKLNLKKPTNARKLEVSLIGKRKTTNYSNGKRNTNYQTVYDFDIPIDGEKEYFDERKDFQIPIPSDLLYAKSLQKRAQDQLEDKLGAAGAFIGAMAMGQSRINWEVRAKLDVPMKLDVKKSQDIVIHEKPEQKEGNI